MLHGLLRVRAFTQDDAHVYCTLEQVAGEVDDICEAIDELYARFGFDDVRVELSTRPEKSIGTDEQWEQAEAALAEALGAQGREYQLNPGDGAFYGPKIDFHVTDALGRSWQLGTCQLDFFMPERFDLSLPGRRQRRAPAGDDPPGAARLDGALRGHPDRALRRPLPDLAGAGAGARPAGRRSPHDYAGEVAARLAAAGVRVRVDERSESVGRKIRDAELAKVPVHARRRRPRAAATAPSRCARTTRGDLGPVPPWPSLRRRDRRSTSGGGVYTAAR